MTLGQSFAAFALAAGPADHHAGARHGAGAAGGGDQRRAWMAGACICTGLLAWTLFASLGVVALLAA
jgi:hypothetical protein